jgi:ABC-type bacteriocin/lantibiotic exporter with double-glycine peptidase domain
MPSNLQFHKQETPDSCVPACIRMVLLTMGTDISEAELRERCDCTIFGTTALLAVDALRALGFTHSRKVVSSIQEITEELALGHLPIVFLNLLPIDGIKVAHAVVLTAIEGNVVYVYDPRRGERIIARSAFEAGWAMMRGLVILIAA